MKIGELCNREVVFAERGCDLLQAAKLMREYHVGCLIVSDRESGKIKPIGIITDRDLVVEAIAEEVELDKVTLADIVIKEPVVAREEDDIYETIEVMRTNGVRRLPVIDSMGYLTGIVTLDDLLEIIAEELVNISKLIVREQQTEEKVH